MTRTVIGHAKRDLKEGEPIILAIRDDGFAESQDIKIRKGLALLDKAELNPEPKQEEENSHGRDNGKSNILGGK